ncbi:PhoU domain-containing protein [Methylomonas sp. MgM2]
MNIQTNEISSRRPLHLFDGELGTLHSLLLEMTDLLMYQIEQILHALDFGDIELALKAIGRDRKVDSCQARIETEVHSILARSASLPNDLRIVMIVSKMTQALEKLGNEFVDLSYQIKTIFEHDNGRNFSEMLAEIIKIGGMIKIMLDKMTVVLETRNSNQAYKIIQYGWNCDTRLQQAVEQQLLATIQDTTVIERTLNVMHILKVLERSANLCRTIAEYQIMMLDSIDMRHHATPAKINAHSA